MKLPNFNYTNKLNKHKITNKNVKTTQRVNSDIKKPKSLFFSIYSKYLFQNFIYMCILECI